MLPSKQEKFYQNETIWLKYTISQDGIKHRRNKQASTSYQHQNIEILPRCHPILPKFHTQPFEKEKRTIRDDYTRKRQNRKGR